MLDNYIGHRNPQLNNCDSAGKQRENCPYASHAEMFMKNKPHTITV